MNSLKFSMWDLRKGKQRMAPTALVKGLVGFSLVGVRLEAQACHSEHGTKEAESGQRITQVQMHQKARKTETDQR